MTSMELLENLIAVKDEYVLEAHSEDIPESNIVLYSSKIQPGRRVSMKRSLLIAAIVAAIMLMLVGCAIALMKLLELKLGEYTYTKPNIENPSEAQTITSDFISLQGLTGSIGYQATKEWKDYLNSYDQDGAIIQGIGNNPTNLDEKYTLYNVYTQEMCDKLEEIAERYGLKLHSEINVVSQEELIYRVGGKFLGNGLSGGWAYIYEDGTFQFDGSAEINNVQILYQFRRSVKGTLDEVSLNVGHVEDYQEFQYVTADDETVLLELGVNKALIIADFEECFITMNVLGGSEHGITEDGLKKIADAIDFTVLKNVIVPDMRGDSITGTSEDFADKSGKQEDEDEKEIEQSNPEIKVEHSESNSEAMLAAYKSVLEDVYQNQRFPGDRYLEYDGFDISINKFAIYDVDNDGREELLIAYITTYMGGMAEIIYDYDSATGAVREEFIEFPFVAYYDNGVIKAGWSHNQGLAGYDFWPYTLYRYNQETDAYDELGMVGAWDKSYAEKDNDDNPFPDEIDENGDGLVYYIMTEGEYERGKPVDMEEYEQWLNSYINGAEIVSIPYQQLTEENIASLY